MIGKPWNERDGLNNRQAGPNRSCALECLARAKVLCEWQVVGCSSAARGRASLPCGKQTADCKPAASYCTPGLLHRPGRRLCSSICCLPVLVTVIWDRRRRRIGGAPVSLLFYEAGWRCSPPQHAGPCWRVAPPLFWEGSSSERCAVLSGSPYLPVPVWPGWVGWAPPAWPGARRTRPEPRICWRCTGLSGRHPGAGGPSLRRNCRCRAGAGSWRALRSWPAPCREACPSCRVSWEGQPGTAAGGFWTWSCSRTGRPAPGARLGLLWGWTAAPPSGGRTRSTPPFGVTILFFLNSGDYKHQEWSPSQTHALAGCWQDQESRSWPADTGPLRAKHWCWWWNAKTFWISRWQQLIVHQRDNSDQRKRRFSSNSFTCLDKQRSALFWNSSWTFHKAFFHSGYRQKIGW